MSPVTAYNPGRIAAAAAAVSQANIDITSALARLEAEVDALRSGWSGDASDAYARAHTRWTLRLSDMNRLLARASSAAVNCADRYERGRARIAARWS